MPRTPTEPYTRRTVPSSAGELPAWLKVETNNIRRAIPLLSRAVQYGTAAPTTGTWERGDIVLDETPTAGSFVGWVCVTAGVPGSWKTFGAISP